MKNKKRTKLVEARPVSRKGYVQKRKRKNTPLKKKVVFRRFYKAGYELRHEKVSFNGQKPILMKLCYTPNGDWIGGKREAHVLCSKKGLTYLQPLLPDDTVCQIGFDPVKQRWYGWSHRAGCGFGIGDKLFEERYGNDKTPFRKHGRKTIRTLEQAKQAAINFAESVS